VNRASLLQLLTENLDTKGELCYGQVWFIYLLWSEFDALSRVVLFLLELDILIFG